MHALAAAVAAPALAGTRASVSRAPFPRTPTRGFATPPRGCVTCRAGGGDIRDVPPDRRRRAPRSASGAFDDARDDSYGYGADAQYGGLDAARDEREDRAWREAYASRVEAKKKRWDAWDALAEEEHARRESAARARAREKAKTSGRTPDQRRVKLDTYRALSRAADEAYGGKVRQRRDAVERRTRIDRIDRSSSTGDVSGRFRRAPVSERGAALASPRRREKMSTDAAMSWLFTPLTRAARGVDEWLNEDIRVTRGRGYEPYPYETHEPRAFPDERRSGAYAASAYDGRRAFDARSMNGRRSYDDDAYGESYGEPYEDDGIGAYRRDDGSEGWLAREKRTPPAAAPRGEPGAYSDGGEDWRRRGSSSNRRADARDWFRGLGDRFSSAPEDAPIDAREFERLRDRR